MKRLTCFGLVFFALVAVAFAGNCTLDVYKRISRERIEYTIYGSRLEGRILYDGVPLDNNVLVWSIDRFIERNRASQTLGGQEIDLLCIGPGLPLNKFFEAVNTGVAMVDPLEPATNESCSGWANPSFKVPCGAVVDYSDVSEWDCDIVHTNTSVGSHIVEIIYVNMTHPSNRSQNLVTSFMLPNENFTFEHAFEQGGYQTLNFVENQLKVNYEMPNSYPFANTDPIEYFTDSFNNHYSNATWLTIFWNMSLSGDREYDVEMAIGGNSAVIKAGPKEYFTVIIDVVTNAFVDGKTTSPPLWETIPLPPFKLTKEMNYSLRVNFGVPLCSGNTSHFDSFWYDPTFGTLFGAGDPTKPITPQERKVQNSQRVVVAVVVSVVVVIVILAIAIPTVAVWFRPYLARRKKGYNEGNLDNAGATSETPNGWTRSAKPSAP